VCVCILYSTITTTFLTLFIYIYLSNILVFLFSHMVTSFMAFLWNGCYFCLITGLLPFHLSLVFTLFFPSLVWSTLVLFCYLFFPSSLLSIVYHTFYGFIFFGFTPQPSCSPLTSLLIKQHKIGQNQLFGEKSIF